MRRAAARAEGVAVGKGPSQVVQNMASPFRQVPSSSMVAPAPLRRRDVLVGSDRQRPKATFWLENGTNRQFGTVLRRTGEADGDVFPGGCRADWIDNAKSAASRARVPYQTDDSCHLAGKKWQ